MTTILKASPQSSGREAVLQALRAAGVGVLEVQDWDQARAQLERCEKALVVCDENGQESGALQRVVAALGKPAEATDIPRDVMRALSHDLRTPLSAMAGWLHLIESGKLDEAGLKRAVDKLKGNIDDQVRTIDKYLATTNQEGRR